MNDVLVKTFSYITIISIIIISLLERPLTRVTAKADESALITAGRRGEGVSP